MNSKVRTKPGSPTTRYQLVHLRLKPLTTRVNLGSSRGQLNSSSQNDRAMTNSLIMESLVLGVVALL